MTSLAITSDLTEEIIRRLRGVLAPEKIILFGSYASGSATPDSDIDLLIVANTDLSPEKRYPIASRALRGLPYAFDLFVKTPQEFERWRKIVNHIAYFADRYGRVIYEQ